MIQEKRGMLKIWNVSLVLATGILAIMGTFLVRSGILDSIHAFGASTLGFPFVVLIGVLIASSVGLVLYRREALRSENKLDSMLSREAVFLGNNLVLVALAFFIFWGTFWPLIAEALTGTRRAVGPPFFDFLAVPLALVLVLLSGIGPVIAWRRATPANARRNFLVPTVLALAIGAVLAALGVASRPYALLMFVFGAFVVFCVAQEFWRGVRVRQAMTGENPAAALVSLVARNRRRYGGYIIHVGMAVLFIGVAASTAFRHATDVQMKPGDAARVGGYDFKYVKPTSRVDFTNAGNLERISFGAIVSVSKDGKKVTTLRPERGYYPSVDVAGLGPIGRFFAGEATSEIGLKAGVRRDLWTAMTPNIRAFEPTIKQGNKLLTPLAGKVSPSEYGIAIGKALKNRFVDAYAANPPPATFRFIVSPLVTWIWFGAIIVFGGGLVAMWPAPDAARRRATARAAARVAEDLGRTEARPA
jgi:cytochrome c-type biogenesis protein CcmF